MNNTVVNRNVLLVAFWSIVAIATIIVLLIDCFSLAYFNGATGQTMPSGNQMYEDAINAGLGVSIISIIILMGTSISFAGYNNRLRKVNVTNLFDPFNPLGVAFWSILALITAGTIGLDLYSLAYINGNITGQSIVTQGQLEKDVINAGFVLSAIGVFILFCASIYNAWYDSKGRQRVGTTVSFGRR